MIKADITLAVTLPKGEQLDSDQQQYTINLGLAKREYIDNITIYTGEQAQQNNLDSKDMLETLNIIYRINKAQSLEQANRAFAEYDEPYIYEI